MPIPGITPQLDSFLRNVYFGQVNVNHYDTFNIRTQCYFDRRNVAAGGFTTATFWDGSSSDTYATNWPSANGLENDKFFWCTHAGFFIEFGTDVDYAAVSNAAMLSRGASTPQFADIESIRKFTQLGRVQGRIGQRIFLDGHGLAMFPSGVMPSIQSSAATTVTTMEQAAAVIQLGENTGPEGAFKFKWPVPIIPQKPVRVTLNHKATFTPSKAFVVGMMLYGVLLEPANY